MEQLCRGLSTCGAFLGYPVLPTHGGYPGTSSDTSVGIMRDSAESDRFLEAPPPERVSEASLFQAARILLPCLASTLPIAIVLTFAVRNQVAHSRLSFWGFPAVAAEVCAVVAGSKFRRERAAGGTGLNSLPFVRTAAAVAGTAWGAAVFVPDASDNELMLLFAVFAFGAGTFGMLLTAPRTDLYALFSVPLFGFASVAVILTPDPMLLSIGVLALCSLG